MPGARRATRQVNWARSRLWPCRRSVLSVSLLVELCPCCCACLPLPPWNQFRRPITASAGRCSERGGFVAVAKSPAGPNPYCSSVQRGRSTWGSAGDLVLICLSVLPQPGQHGAQPMHPTDWRRRSKSRCRAVHKGSCSGRRSPNQFRPSPRATDCFSSRHTTI